MKTLLIPTDLTVESLATLKAALSDDSIRPVNIVLIYGYRSPDNMVSLIYDQAKGPSIGEEFREAIKLILYYEGPNVTSVRIVPFSSNTTAAMANFIEAYNIDLIYTPVNLELMTNDPKSFDVMPYLKGQKVPTKKVHFQNQYHKSA